MLFLGVTEKLQIYFHNFENVLKEKNLNWQKFLYVKKIFDFREENVNENIDEVLTLELYNSIYKEHDLCLHDHKMILLLLESFQDIAFIEVLVNYLDENYPDMANLYFNKLFIEHFEEKYGEIRYKLMSKI